MKDAKSAIHCSPKVERDVRAALLAHFLRDIKI